MDVHIHRDGKAHTRQNSPETHVFCQRVFCQTKVERSPARDDLGAPSKGEALPWAVLPCPCKHSRCCNVKTVELRSVFRSQCLSWYTAAES
eukprot:4867443-Amphidinium_carterae.1